MYTIVHFCATEEATMTSLEMLFLNTCVLYKGTFHDTLCPSVMYVLYVLYMLRVDRNNHNRIARACVCICMC